MRFMLLLKGDPQGEAPPPELIDAMQHYIEDLAKAGVLLAAEGLHDSSHAARVVYSAGAKKVIDGPFAESKELIAGFYLIDVPSIADAIEWAKRCPVEVAAEAFAHLGGGEAVVEVRRVADMSDLPTASEEQIAAEQRVRDQIPGL